MNDILANRKSAKRRALNGGKPLLIDTTLLRQHLASLRSHGMGVRQISAVSGVHRSIIQAVNGRQRPMVTGHTHMALMAVEPSLALGTMVPVLATRRRLQALARIGWTYAKLGAEMGLQGTYVARLASRQTQVTYSTELSIGRHYERLSGTSPRPANRYEAANSRRQVDRAVRKGWPPPAAWDDEDLYDPKAKPKGVRAA